MTKAEFNQRVDELLARAKALRLDDFYEATSIIRAFESFAHQHHEYIEQFTTEHLYSIEADFENMRKYKRPSTKSDYFNAGKRQLITDIESMKRNRVPE